MMGGMFAVLVYGDMGRNGQRRAVLMGLGSGVDVVSCRDQGWGRGEMMWVWVQAW